LFSVPLYCDTVILSSISITLNSDCCLLYLLMSLQLVFRNVHRIDRWVILLIFMLFWSWEKQIKGAAKFSNRTNWNGIVRQPDSWVRKQASTLFRFCLNSQICTVNSSYQTIHPFFLQFYIKCTFFYNFIYKTHIFTILYLNILLPPFFIYIYIYVWYRWNFTTTWPTKVKYVPLCLLSHVL
jgi:hypothetical protein